MTGPFLILNNLSDKPVRVNFANVSTYEGSATSSVVIMVDGTTLWIQENPEAIDVALSKLIHVVNARQPAS